MEIRELLSFYEYDGDNTPVIRGSALGGLNKEEKWMDKIMELMDCLLYTSDAADDLLCVDLGGRRLIKKKK